MDALEDLPVPEPLTRDVARRVSDDAIETGAAVAGVQPHEYRAALEDAVRERLPTLSPWVRTTPTALGKILAQGRWKTQHEITRSGGLYAPRLRAEYEEVAFGLHPTGTPPEKRPVYGYLTGHPDGRTASRYVDDSTKRYGLVAVRLKHDRVAPRTTWTAGDSLTNMYSARPTPLLEPGVQSLNADHIRDEPHPWAVERRTDLLPGEEGSYVEAQYHGGLTPQDVEEVVFHGPGGHADLAAELEKRGIAHREAEPVLEPDAPWSTRQPEPVSRSLSDGSLDGLAPEGSTLTTVDSVRPVSPFLGRKRKPVRYVP